MLNIPNCKLHGDIRGKLLFSSVKQLKLIHDFVFWVKHTIFWLNRGLRVYFDLYAPTLLNTTYKYFFDQIIVWPIFQTKSMHTDFFVQAICTICWLNTGLRVYLEFYAPDFQKSIRKYFSLSPADLLKVFFLRGQNLHS